MNGLPEGSPSPSDRRDAEAALAAERDQTEARLASLERAYEEIVAYSDGTPPDDEHDPEGATVGWERAQLSALRDQARAHLGELEAAAQRLRDGSYGRCESCGRSIGAERLLARPATRRCVACATVHRPIPLEDRP